MNLPAQETHAKSRTERTFAALRQALISGEFLPGIRLRIDQLGKQFDASTGAVRESLSRLTAEGLVVAEPQKGFVDQGRGLQGMVAVFPAKSRRRDHAKFVVD